MSINLTILNHVNMLRKPKFDPYDHHHMCSVFVMLFDKIRYLNF